MDRIVHNTVWVSAGDINMREHYAKKDRGLARKTRRAALTSKAPTGGIDSRCRRYPLGITAVLKGNNHQS